MTQDRLALNSKCLVCDKTDLPLANLSKNVPIGHGKKWNFWHKVGCKDNSQGSVGNINVKYWDIIAYDND